METLNDISEENSINDDLTHDQHDQEEEESRVEQQPPDPTTTCSDFTEPMDTRDTAPKDHEDDIVISKPSTEAPSKDSPERIIEELEIESETLLVSNDKKEIETAKEDNTPINYNQSTTAPRTDTGKETKTPSPEIKADSKNEQIVEVGSPPDQSKNLPVTQEKNVYNNLDEIWSSGDHTHSPEADREELVNVKKETDDFSSFSYPRSRSNAVRINHDNILFQSSSKNSIFSDEDNESPTEEALLTFLSGVEPAGGDATLTRSNVNRDTASPLATYTACSPSAERLLIQSHQSSHSHSVSSSYSIEDTYNHPLSSDSETEEDEEDLFRGDRHESVIASDYYSLVDQLVSHSNDDKEAGFSGKRERAEAFVPPVREQAEDELGGGLDPVTADKWDIVPQPSRHAIQSMCLSSTSLWLISARSCVYWSLASNGGQSWQEMKKSISHISSSADGSVVWGVHHHQAYVRHGISELNPAGSTWYNVTRNGSVSRKIKLVSCDFNAVWALATDGRVLFRRGVSDGFPEGKVWIEAKSSNTFVQISSCGGIVWALDVAGRAYVRENVKDSTPSGTQWRDVKSPQFTAVSVLENGLIWGISVDDRLWFRCGATSFEPEGSGHWWEVTIGTLSKPSVAGLVDAMWKVRSTELRSNSFLQTVTSKLVHSPSNNKFVSLSACARSGICLLSSDNELHACWNPITGYHRQPACNDPIFGLTTWRQSASFNSILWAVRENGELYCFPSSDKSVHIECQDQVRVLSASPSAVWALTRKDIWSRQGICDEIPQGYSWDYIELGTHMQTLKIKHLAIGNNVAWAVDDHGKLHFRFGIHPREPGTGMAPAWIEVPDQKESPLQADSIVFESIVVSPDDWLVWALDQNGIPYVRKGVTSNFPVGRHWEVVKGEKIKSLAASSSKIFAISTDGDLLRRKPITEKLPAGIYWRKLPGKFDLLSASPSGDLWLTGEKGFIVKQKSKVVMVNPRKEKEALEQCYEEDWDVL